LSDGKRAIDFKVIAKVQPTKEDLVNFLKRNSHIIEGKAIQFDRFFKEITEIGKELNFIPIIKTKSKSKPYITEIERFHGLWKKHIYNIRKLIKRLLKETNEGLVLELIEAIIKAQLFKDPTPLLKFHLQNHELIEKLEHKRFSKHELTKALTKH